MSTIPHGYKQTEVGVIPEDWVCLSVKDIAANCANAIVGGPFGSDLVSKDYVAAGVPVVRGQNMALHYVSGEFAFISESKAKYLQANTARPNDIIVTQRGTLGQISIVPSQPFEKYIISQSQMKLTLNADMADSEYVYQYFLNASGQKQILDSAIQTGVPHTNLGILRSYKIPAPPTLVEQQAIAEALSDADALIESLEQLIVKKRQIKQGAMQELLTGRKRLPGFAPTVANRAVGATGRSPLQTVTHHDLPDGWEVKPLGEIAHIKTGSCNNQDKVEDGNYPFFVRSATVERINSYSYDCEAILVPGEGGIGSIFHYINGRFDVHQRVYAITQFAPDVSGKYVYLYMTVHFGAHAMQNSVKATVDSLRLPTFQKFEIALPPTEKEQTAIASILSEMDTELAALETKLAKTRQLKQGMMQELLTGRIRLI